MRETTVKGGESLAHVRRLQTKQHREPTESGQRADRERTESRQRAKNRQKADREQTESRQQTESREKTDREQTENRQWVDRQRTDSQQSTVNRLWLGRGNMASRGSVGLRCVLVLFCRIAPLADGIFLFSLLHRSIASGYGCRAPCGDRPSASATHQALAVKRQLRVSNASGLRQ
ncbi:hypothetical protein Bbelb_340100 [Branchiostoma belcheri]|nr:hypothetical protein Bbelb_340100 [Branchiostoma belcheri]